jgi:hypothetical protein
MDDEKKSIDEKMWEPITVNDDFIRPTIELKINHCTSVTVEGFREFFQKYVAVDDNSYEITISFVNE